jgi:enoyl-CoA hydratase
MKMLVNSAVEQQGLATTQMLGTLLDGAARHTPEGSEFSRSAAADLHAAVRARDERFGDYGFGSRTVRDPLA